MAQTIYASFNSIELAEKAAGALLDHGILKEDLSLVANGGDRLDQVQEVGTYAVAPEYVTGQPSYGSVAYAGPIDAGAPGYLSPAQATTAGLSNAATTTGDYDGTTTDRYPDPGGRGAVDDERSRAESVVKSGITTTTPEDAGAGALKGTGVGLGVGILAGLAALVIPGVGLVIGGGALAAAIGAAALTTAAGAATGGLIGYLKDQGINETDAYRFQQAVGSGGALVAVSLPSNGIGLEETELVLNKYGATDISSY